MAAIETPDVDGPSAFGEGDEAITRRWISELDLADRSTAAWDTRARKIIQRYKDDPTAKPGDLTPVKRRFSILWSNVQTIGPAIYAHTPQAVVSRRFKDADPVGKWASEVLERASNYSLEEYDFNDLMVAVRQDFLLPGRGQLWVRYQPQKEMVRTDLTPVVAELGAQISDTVDEEQYEDATGKKYKAEEVQTDEKGAYIEEEQVTYEEVVCDHIAWDDFLTNPAREWAEVRWVARRVFMTRDELRARFGKEIGSLVPLDWVPAEKTGDEKRDEQFKKAQVYEIWDKVTEKVYWISKSYPAKALDIRDDPLGLTGFFPCPRPATATTGPDSIIPVPDYIFYQDQAEELDELTGRIGKLVDALRMVGFYAGENKIELQNVFASGNENKLIPIESWAAFSEKGGVRGMLEWVPIDMVIQALQGCFETRQRILEDIYQITGISDIVRGDGDPNETATAAGIKAQWGSIRVRDRQRELSRFARDVIRIKAEIIAEKFSIDTLKAMTGVELLTEAEKQQAQMQMQAMEQMQAQYAQIAQQAQAAGQQPPLPPQMPPMPENIQELMERPTWEQVKGLLENNALRQFRIEIETDSTIEPNETEQKQQAIEFVTTIGTLIGNALPAVQAAPPLGELVGESVKFLTRRFRIGREMEETIDRVVSQISQQQPVPQEAGPPPPDPAVAQAAQTKAEADIIKAQAENKRTDADIAYDQADIQIRGGELALKAQALERDPNPQAVN